jgi:hypothetical protein
MNSLHKIKEPLLELNNMIGMKNIKENILYQLSSSIIEMLTKSLTTKTASKAVKVITNTKSQKILLDFIKQSITNLNSNNTNKKTLQKIKLNRTFCPSILP